MRNPFVLFILLFSSSLTYAQVGIGTTNPEADLHVAGDMLVKESFKVGNLNTVSPIDENFKLVTRNTNSVPVGEITVLDVDSLTVAPVNNIDYHFTNISLDNLTDVDLQYNTNKYIVAIANFRYVGDPVKKVIDNNGRTSIGNFVVRTFESNNTWHLEISNRSLDLNASDTLEYYVTLVIYDKSYYRNLPSITTDLEGENSGTASSIPVLF